MSITIKGWLTDSQLPEDTKKELGDIRSFSSVEHSFRIQHAPRSIPGKSYDIPNEPPCYDQGDFGSCVINAVCGAINIVLANNKQQTAALSRMFLYWLCRDAMKTTDTDSGTYPFLAVDRVGKIGICRESTWAYTAENMYAPPPPETYPEASDNKATAWFRIDAQGAQRLSQLESALRSNHPVIYGSPISEDLLEYRKGQVLTIPDPKRSLGGHATVFTGVRYLNGKRVWRVRNSWGTKYGDDGHFLIDDAWAAWPELEDLWVLTRADPLLF